MPVTTEHTATIGQKLRDITEAGAAAAVPWIGSGAELDPKSPEFNALKIKADGAAVDAIRPHLDGFAMLVCEGKKDESAYFAPGVYGQEGVEPKAALILDPVERTTELIKGGAGAMCVAASLPVGAYPKSSGAYMRKLVVPKVASEVLSEGGARINGDAARVLHAVAEAMNIKTSELRVALLDRKDRNQDVFRGIQSVGATAVKLEGGDILPIVEILQEDKGDLIYFGSGGVTEGLAAGILVAIRGGGMQVMADPRTKQEEKDALAEGLLGRVINLATLAGNHQLYFSATPITDSHPPQERPTPLMRGWTQDSAGSWHPGTTYFASKP
jgi:fructose-1,6-bisphosphatase/sedoheptulose 1,7-bisphosphatase-like protein